MNPLTEAEKIEIYLPQEKAQTILQLQAQKKPLFCHLPLFMAHNWSSNENGIRYCLKCGRVDFYFGLTGVIRRLEEDGTLRKWEEEEACLKT